MHDSSRTACLTLSLIMVSTFSTAAWAGSSTTTTAGGANRAGTGSTAGTNNGVAHNSGGAGLLCAGLLGSGILSDIFTVASSTPRHEDPNEAIRFAPIWSDSHQATVGSTAPPEPPKSKLAVATVKLPIAFSEVDRQKFIAAGWKLRKATGTLGGSYCLDRTSRGDAAASPAVQGMICVTAAP